MESAGEGKGATFVVSLPLLVLLEPRELLAAILSPAGRANGPKDGSS